MSELPYRLCAIDLDDTLLDSEQRISERNARAVRAILARGVHVVFASGRMHESALRFAQQLGVLAPIISYNGAMVKDPATDEVWLHECVDGEPASVIMDYCRERDLQLNYYRDHVVYTQAMTPWLELYQRRTLAPIEIRPDFYTALRGLPTTKLVIVDSPERTNALKPVFEEIFGPQLYITKTADEYLEFMPPTANKGAALEIVASKWGISAAQAVAFGDGQNDIPMLRWAGLGIALGNAKPELKAVADRVIGHHDEDAVGIALEEIFGLSA